MVTIGIDAHKRSHTAVVVDEHGLKLAQRTSGTTSPEHLELVAWAATHARACSSITATISSVSEPA